MRLTKAWLAPMLLAGSALAGTDADSTDTLSKMIEKVSNRDDGSRSAKWAWAEAVDQQSPHTFSGTAIRRQRPPESMVSLDVSRNTDCEADAHSRWDFGADAIIVSIYLRIYT